MRKSNIPTYDLYVGDNPEPIIQGVHKADINVVIADLKRDSIPYTLTRSKAVKSSRFSKHRKDGR